MQKIIDMLKELLGDNGSASENLNPDAVAQGIPGDAPLPDDMPSLSGGMPDGLPIPAEVPPEPEMPEGVPMAHDMVFVETDLPDDLMLPSMMPDPLPAPGLSLPDDPGQPTETPVSEFAGMPDFGAMTGLPGVALDALPSIVGSVAMAHDEDDEDEDLDLLV